MEQHPDFQHEEGTQTLERTRQLANKRGQIIWDQQFYGINEVGFLT